MGNRRIFLTVEAGGNANDGSTGPLGSLVLPIGAYDGANTNIATQSGTSFYKLEAEAPFIGVRIWLLNSLDIATSGVSALVAPTETAASDDTNKAYYPYQGGVRNDGLWKRFKFRGRQTATLPLGAGTQVFTDQLLRPGFVRSAYLSCPSIPRADGGPASRHLAMLRIFNGAGGSKRSFNQAVGTSGAATRGTDYYRAFQARDTHPTTQPGVDGVSDVTIKPLAGDSSQILPVLGFGCQPGLCWVAVEFVYASAHRRTFLALGDSITCRYSTFRYGADHWLAKSMWGASDPTEPITFVNGGLNGRTSAEWTPWFNEVLATGWQPTDFLCSSFEVNDDVNAGTAGADVRHAAISTILDTCNSRGIQPWLWTPQPRDDYGTTQDAVRLYSDQWARDQVTAGRAKLVDIKSVLDNGASPGRYISGLGAGDNIHPGPLGGDAMTTLVKPLFMSTHAPRIVQDVGIIGTACNGGTVYAAPSIVTANPAVSGRTYQWTRNGSNIGAATSSSYSPVAGDYAQQLAVVETVTNSQGSVISTSAAVTVSATAPTVSASFTTDFSTLTLSNLTGGAGADTHPLNGGATNLLAETVTASVAHSIALPAIAAVSVGLTCTFWCLARFTVRGVIQMSVSTAFNTGMFANYDLQNGRVSQPPTNGSARMVPVWISGVLWFYCELTGIATGAIAPDPQIWFGFAASFRRGVTYTGATANTVEFAQINFEKSAPAWVGTVPNV